MSVFVGNKSSNDIINNGTMSDEEVVASDLPPWFQHVAHAVRMAVREDESFEWIKDEGNAGD